MAIYEDFLPVRNRCRSGPHRVGGISRLIDKLQQLGVADNTLVILSSDNGPEIDAIVNMRKDYGHDGARPTL